MKKTLLNLFAIILAVSMVFTMAPLSMEKAYAEGTAAIDGMMYSVDEEYETAALYSLEDKEQSTITIPSGFNFEGRDYTVTSIRSSAFYYCTNLTTVTIPESVTSIEEGAFNDCTGLTTVNFGGSKAQWDAITGDGKPTGTGVTVNYAKEYPVFTTINGVAYVLNEENEERMATVTGYTADLPADVTIPPSVKYENEDFTVKSIKAFAFNECGTLKTITIPEGVTNIGNCAFWDSGLTSVTFAEGSKLTTIDEGAFAECQSLGTVTIPESVTSIGENAFENCTGMTTITIPESVTSIGKNAFSGCSGLTTVNFGGSKSQWDAITGDGKPTGVTLNYAKYYPVFTTINGVAYVLNEDRTATVTRYTDDLPADVIIPLSVTYENKEYSVTSLGNNAFTRCSALKTIKLPDSLIRIGNYAFRWSGLESIIISASVTSIGWEAFLDAKQLTTVAFAEGSLIKAIPENTFYGCTNLATITIPESVTSIGKNAFYGCTGLTTVNYGGSKSQWDAITGEGKPTNVTVICAKEYPAPTTVGGVVYLLNENGTATVTGYTADLPAEVIIPQSIKYENEDFSVKSIKDFAFMDCSSLKNITIPEGVTNIGNCAFWDSGLTSVTFEEGSKLTTIDAGAFAGCQSLGAITIPEGVTSIKKNAFYSCNSMETITIPESVTSIGEYAFYNCFSMTTITIPESVTS
ncbi:MAG: leucine-rich repeat protein, partial [Firmicutes bacterium]|nr:leucine-rich repeat protein [Bacillota bacterium]